MFSDNFVLLRIDLSVCRSQYTHTMYVLSSGKADRSPAEVRLSLIVVCTVSKTDIVYKFSA